MHLLSSIEENSLQLKFGSASRSTDVALFQPSARPLRDRLCLAISATLVACLSMNATGDLLSAEQSSRDLSVGAGNHRRRVLLRLEAANSRETKVSGCFKAVAAGI